MQPVTIKVIKSKDIFIEWDDETLSEINVKKLREFCPCATCLTFRERQGKDYIPIFNENQLKIANIQQIGGYAIQITWKDGHNTGIYEFSFLKNLGSKN